MSLALFQSQRLKYDESLAGAAVATGRRVVRRRARAEVEKCMIIPYECAVASSKSGSNGCQSR
jgi:hypothetical protein